LITLDTREVEINVSLSQVPIMKQEIFAVYCGLEFTKDERVYI